MSTRKIPDTNIILRYLLADNEEQYLEISPFFKGLREGRQKALVPAEVIVEAFYVLTKVYDVPPKKAAGALKEILLYKGIDNKDRDILIEALNRYEYTSGLSLLDCLIWVKSEAYGCELLTFDKKLKRISRG
jgi:predicted nucleic-acid-binding protein